MDITAAPSREITELFVIPLEVFRHKLLATFARSKAEGFGHFVTLEVRGPIAERYGRDFSLVPLLAHSSIELAQVAQEDFGVELKFHLNLENDFRPVMVIDSGAQEFLDVVEARKNNELLGYARHITDDELPWGYISDILNSVYRIVGRR